MDPLLQEIYSMDKATMERCAQHLMLGGGTRGGPVLVRGKGVRVWDTDGKDYVDCTSQSWAMYLGHANEDINRIVADHMQNLSHVHQGFDTPMRFYLADKLAQISPGDLNRVSFTVGGGPGMALAMDSCSQFRTSPTQKRNIECPVEAGAADDFSPRRCQHGVGSCSPSGRAL